MKLAVEFPSVIYREGPRGVAALAQAIERAGYDQLDMFDHVVMPWPSESRPGLRYPADMPILEALMALAFVAAVTERIGLGTEVLVLPQRQPVLVAKQVSTLDTLSAGRVRLGVGTGWQESEYQALGADFHRRGKAMDEAVELLRACWRQREVDFAGAHYRVQTMAMEPKPPRPGGPPIWLGGSSPAALRRAGRLADGWLANVGCGAEQIAAVKQAAEQAGRDPDALGFQAQLSAPPHQGEAASSGVDGLVDGIVAGAGAAVADGFDWATVNATVLFRAGARRGEQLAAALATLHDRLRAEVG